MKKLILIGLFALLTCVVFAQDAIIVKADVGRTKEYDSSLSKWESWSNWIDVDIVIVIDYSNNLVKIDNKYGDKFKILSKYENTTGIDSEDGDPFTNYNFDAIDKEGNRMLLSIRYFDSGVYQVGVLYSDYMYMYQGKELTF